MTDCCGGDPVDCKEVFRSLEPPSISCTKALLLPGRVLLLMSCAIGEEIVPQIGVLLGAPDFCRELVARVRLVHEAGWIGPMMVLGQCPFGGVGGAVLGFKARSGQPILVVEPTRGDNWAFHSFQIASTNVIKVVPHPSNCWGTRQEWAAAIGRNIMQSH
jgi:hypothetical protein